MSAAVNKACEEADDKRKGIWKRHFEEIMNVENEYVTDDLPVTHGPCQEFSQGSQGCAGQYQ